MKNTYNVTVEINSDNDLSVEDVRRHTQNELRAARGRFLSDDWRYTIEYKVTKVGRVLGAVTEREI